MDWVHGKFTNPWPQAANPRDEPHESANRAGLALTRGQYGHYDVTMKSARNTIPAGQFKARCLGLLDQVATSGETLVITKRGKPVAKLVPVEQTPPESLRGSVQYHGDIVGPLGEEWEADL